MGLDSVNLKSNNLSINTSADCVEKIESQNEHRYNKIVLALSAIVVAGSAILIGKSLFSIENESSLQDVFTQIYQTKKWGTNANGIGSSGDGSTLKSTEVYRKFMQDFLKTNNISSVVDVGCGDWEFSKAMNWNGIKYTGYDVVPSVIAANIQKYNASNIQFIHGDATKIDLPKADLLISKDVLQHLADKDIHSFIPQLKKYKFALLTNDVNPLTNSSDNLPIARGSEREIDLTKPPFSLNGIKVLTFLDFVQF